MSPFLSLGKGMIELTDDRFYNYSAILRTREDSVTALLVSHVVLECFDVMIVYAHKMPIK